jgi:hypothetical protein
MLWTPNDSKAMEMRKRRAHGQRRILGVRRDSELVINLTTAKTLDLTSHDRVPLAPEHESHIKLMSLYVAGGHGQEVAFSLAV